MTGVQTCSSDLKEILKGLNMTINKGEVHVIMGPNGAGKSTLASILVGHPKHELVDGEIILDGENINEDAVDERAKKGIFSNLRLVVSIAFRYAVPTIPAMDIIQEGNLGLMAAAEKFDPAFNTRFSTYAYIWIVQYINRYIRLKDTAIPLPAMKEELVRAVTSASDELCRHFRKEPTVRAERSEERRVGKECRSRWSPYH